ncbi:uncharacterized protein LOC110679478 [Aedes aegypti]|uniref:Uncharacterized protein n=1 Tax=Aedes aegypti TaxID=7159 RepID=A0A6I8U8X6_AEDAE|nr:uncharacterized protein LOC110679478 [Aedes aegypti]
MACKTVALIVLILIDLVRAAPTWYNQESWNYAPELTYKDYLKKVGAYPRIFRYGTQADPVYQGDYSNWFDPYPSYQPAVVQGPSQYGGQDSWWQDDWNRPGYIRYNDEYEQHALQQAQQMEQEVADILWRW